MTKHCSKSTVLMAFDFGLKRIGVAFGNGLTKTAQGVGVVQADNDSGRFEQIEKLVKEWQPEGFVVGVPRHPDGQPNDLTERCEKFARQLTGRFGLSCETVDERYTSAVVESLVGGRSAREQKGRIDMQSACLILEQYFLEK